MFYAITESTFYNLYFELQTYLEFIIAKLIINGGLAVRFCLLPVKRGFEAKVVH